jgi:hypothetical protein
MVENYQIDTYSASIDEAFKDINDNFNDYGIITKAFDDNDNDDDYNNDGYNTDNENNDNNEELDIIEKKNIMENKPYCPDKFDKVEPDSRTMVGYSKIEDFNGSLWNEYYNEKTLLKSILIGLLFYILANPRSFKYTNFISNKIDKILLHSILFTLIVYIINQIF